MPSFFPKLGSVTPAVMLLKPWLRFFLGFALSLFSPFFPPLPPLPLAGTANF